MTDDITRALRRQIAQLQATQTYLRVAASKALPFPNVWRAEARGEQRCHELLEALGMEFGRIRRAQGGSHSTSVRPVTMSRPQTRTGEPAARASSMPPARREATRKSGLVSFDDAQPEGGPAIVSYDADEGRTVIGGRSSAGTGTSTRGTPVRAGARPAARPSGGRPRATPSQPLVRGGSGPQARWGRGPESRTPGLTGRAELGRDSLVTLQEDEVLDADEEKLFGDEGATVVGDPRDALPPNEPEPARTPTPTPAESPEPARATSGLYGGGASVPSVRASSTRPRAAAVQLNKSGTGGRVVGTEDDIEPIEIGAADDDDDYVDGGPGGFSVTLQQDPVDDLGPASDDDLPSIADVGEETPEPAPSAARAPGVPAEEVARLYAEAERAAAGGDLGAAADFFSDVVDADPEHHEAFVARGRVFLDLGDYSRAMSDFMVAEEIIPNNPEPQVAIGDLYFARKDYRRAIEYFNAALDLDPEHAMAFCRRGISHYYRKNYNDALEDLLHAQQLRPDIPNLTTYVAMAQKKKQRKKRP